jgi:hypothetical protein
LNGGEILSMALKIDIAELKIEGEDIVKKLADFLKGKIGKEVELSTDQITVKDENKEFSKGYLRVLLRKFLHQRGLKEYFRVISLEGGTLKIKERKLREEE